MDQNTVPNTGKEKKDSGYKVSLKRSKIAGILCLVIIAGVFFFLSPVFDAKKIEVIGNKIHSESVILEASGFKNGDNIFRLDVNKASEEILKLDYVSEVNISRQLPSKVTIEIDEEYECAYIAPTSASAAEKYVGVNENCKIISLTKDLRDSTPVVKGIKLTESEKGQFIKIDDDNAKELSDLLCRILGELKKQDILPQIKEIILADKKNIQMMLDTDTLVNFGEDGDEDGDNIEYKIAFLKAIISEPRQGGGVIELADTDNVTERMSRD